jgi:hypothetical protein
VIGALLARFVRSRLPLLLVGVAGTVLVVWTWNVWPLETWAPVWALGLIIALVVAALHDTGDEAD